MPCSEPLDKLLELRASTGAVIPVTVIAYEPSVGGDMIQKDWFTQLAGEGGEFLADTSKQDMEFIDKALVDVKKKKKQAEKFEKKLGNMEDLSEKVEENRALYRQQESLQRLVKNDL